MRSVPDYFLNQKGIEPLFVIDVHWSTGTVRYSKKEWDEDTYAYISKVSGYEALSHTDGFGQISKVEVTFFDQFGHFKEKLDKEDIFNKSVTVDVYIASPDTLLLLFEGIFEEPITWAEKQFTVTIIDSFQDKLFTYKQEDGKVWPQIYGHVKNYEAVLKSERPFAEITADTDYSSTGPLDLPVEFDSDLFDLNTEYFMNIVGNANNGKYSILATGSFIDEDTFRIPTPSAMTIKWYQEIPFTVDELIGVGDDGPLTKITIAPDGSTLGPDGEPTTNVNLQFMQLKIAYDYTGFLSSFGSSPFTACVKQEGNTCWIQGYKHFYTAPQISNLRIVYASKCRDFVYKFAEGTKLYKMDHTDKFVVQHVPNGSLPLGFTLNSVKMQVGEELITIPETDYSYDTSTDPEPHGFIEFSFDMYMRYLEQYEDQQIGPGIYINGTSTNDTDKLMLEKVSGLTVTNDTVDTTVNCAILEESSIVDVMTDVAWQARKGIRRTVDGITLVRLNDPNDPVFTFTDSDVLANSLQYTMSPKEALKTVFNVTAQGYNMLKEPKQFIQKKNVDKYGEKEYQCDFFIYKYRKGLNNSLSFWKDRLSRYRRYLKFTTFLSSFRLEVWDRVTVNITDPVFYDPSNGHPLTNTHTASPISWNTVGFVREISNVDFEQGTMDIEIELEIGADEEPNTLPPRVVIA